MMSSKLTIRNCTFAFKCNANWDELEDTTNEDVKLCHNCEKEVYFCNDDEDLARNVRLNRCVAFYRFGASNQVYLGDVRPSD